MKKLMMIACMMLLSVGAFAQAGKMAFGVTALSSLAPSSSMSSLTMSVLRLLPTSSPRSMVMAFGMLS